MKKMKNIIKALSDLQITGQTKCFDRCALELVWERVIQETKIHPEAAQLLKNRFQGITKKEECYALAQFVKALETCSHMSFWDFLIPQFCEASTSTPSESHIRYERVPLDTGYFIQANASHEVDNKYWRIAVSLKHATDSQRIIINYSTNYVAEIVYLLERLAPREIQIFNLTFADLYELILDMPPNQALFFNNTNTPPVVTELLSVSVHTKAPEEVLSDPETPPGYYNEMMYLSDSPDAAEPTTDPHTPSSL